MSDENRPPFGRIAIIGTGLIGGSIALAARRVWPSVRVVGTPSRRGPLPAGLLDDEQTDVARLALAADLVVLATPVSVMAEAMAAIVESGATPVVTDVGSTKRRVIQAARDAGLSTFVGGHPMAGGERPGATEARADLFVDRPWLFVEGTADRLAGARVEAFARGLGARTRWLPADIHDRTVAYVSHLPQIVAAALMNAADGVAADEGPHVAGNAFGEMTRLASSPAAMWQGICADNADYVAEALRGFLAQLPDEASLTDGRWVAESLARSGKARDRWRRRASPGTEAGD